MGARLTKGAVTARTLNGMLGNVQTERAFWRIANLCRHLIIEAHIFSRESSTSSIPLPNNNSKYLETNSSDISKRTWQSTLLQTDSSFPYPKTQISHYCRCRCSKNKPGIYSCHTITVNGDPQLQGRPFPLTKPSIRFECFRIGVSTPCIQC